MTRILTKAQLSKLEGKSQAELLALVLDLAAHFPSVKKHLINHYLTADSALFDLAKKEYRKLTRRSPSWDCYGYDEVDTFFCDLQTEFIPLLAKGVAASPKEGEIFAAELLASAKELYENMDTSSGSWEDYHLALVEQWLMAIGAQRGSVTPEVLASRLREGWSKIDPPLSITYLFNYPEVLGSPLIRALRDNYAAVNQLPEALALSFALRDVAFFDSVQQAGAFSHPRQQLDYARLLIDELRAEQAIAILLAMESAGVSRYRELREWHQVLIQAYLEEGHRADAHAQALRAFTETRESSFFASYCQSGDESSEVALAQFVAVAETWGLVDVLLFLHEIEAWPQLAQRLELCTDAVLHEKLSALRGSTVRTWSSTLHKQGFTVVAVRLRRHLVANIIDQGKSTYYSGAASDLKMSLDYQATLKVEQENEQNTLSSPHDYLDRLYKQHRRKTNFWYEVTQKLPTIIISANGLQYQPTN
ncbi:MAG: hypothetical protein ACRCWB_02585 [Enterovibrio sp.]